jgi:cardiolipin synthase A/B
VPSEAIPIVETGSYPTRRGNQVIPWVDGAPAFRRICEAIEAAQESVWVTVTFMWPSFQMPDGRGSTLDVLERAARRDIDVRVIFWRPDDKTVRWRRNAFWGSSAHFDLLSRRASGLKIRWDRAHPGFCQHQKTWLIDATRDVATSFIGGMNLNPHALATPDHDGEDQHHDIYVEMRGPAVADVHHNFTQRWNEASECDRSDGRWGNGSRDGLDYPTHLPAERGRVQAQVQRTIHAGCYVNGHPSPGGPHFPIERGERTILDQYCTAIGAARRTIYIENQYFQSPDILRALEATLARDVQVVVMLPAVPEISAQVRSSPEYRAVAEVRARLASHESFAMCGIAGRVGDGTGVRSTCTPS